MHDPMTVAFTVKYPWHWWAKSYKTPLATIWHCDPERGGDDDSCDWFNRGKAEDRANPLRLAVSEAIWGMETLLDNRPHYPDSPEHRRFQPLKAAIRALMAPPRRSWWRHPRWHVWHWKIQLHPWQDLKRRFWDKCCRCGRRGFRPGESAIGTWSGDQIWHSGCDDAAANVKQAT